MEGLGRRDQESDCLFGSQDALHLIGEAGTTGKRGGKKRGGRRLRRLAGGGTVLFTCNLFLWRNKRTEHGKTVKGSLAKKKKRPRDFS